MFVRVTSNPTTVQLPKGASEVAVLSLSTNEQKEYSEADEFAITGIEDFALDRCESKQEFRQSFNANHFFYLDGASRWSLSDLYQITGERPLGLYEAEEQYYVVTKDADYVMRPLLHADAWSSITNRLLVRANNLRGLLDLQGTYQYQSVGQTRAIHCVTDLTAPGFVPQEFIKPSFTRARKIGREIILQDRGSIGYPSFQQGDRFHMSLVGANTGLLINMPILVFNVPHNKFTDYREAYAYVRIRVGAAVEMRNITQTNPIPADAQEIIVRRLLTGYQFVIEMRDSTDTVIEVFRSVHMEFGEFSIVNQKTTETSIFDPVCRKYRYDTLYGQTTLAFQAPQNATGNSYELLESPKGDVEVQNGDLIIAGVDTQLTITPNQAYVVHVNRQATQLDVQVFQGNTLQEYSETNPSYIDSQTAQGQFRLRQNAVISLFAIGNATNFARSDLEGQSVPTVNLGATLTLPIVINGVTYEAVDVNLSIPTATILRIDQTIAGHVTQGHHPAYEERYHFFDVLCDQALGDTGHVIAHCERNQNPVVRYVPIDTSSGSIDIRVHPIDEQTGERDDPLATSSSLILDFR